VIADIIAAGGGCCRCGQDTAVRQRALDLNGTTDAFANIRRKMEYGIDMATRKLTNHQHY